MNKPQIAKFVYRSGKAFDTWYGGKKQVLLKGTLTRKNGLILTTYHGQPVAHVGVVRLMVMPTL